MKFFKSILLSIREGIVANPEIRKIVQRYPGFFAFLKRRLDRSKFSGLPLTFLLIIFLYVFYLFVGTIQDVVTAGPPVAADIRIANLLYAFRDLELIRVFLWITLFAKWQTITIFILITAVLLWLWKKRMYIAPFFVTLGGSYLFYALIKIITHRLRPDIAYYLEKGYAFPSGHSTTAVAFYGFIAYILIRQCKSWKTKIGILLAGLIIIFGVGFSRIYLGVHYLSDVWGGYLLGALWLIIGISITEWRKEQKQEEPVTAHKTAKLFSVLLPITGLIFYLGFALQYNPPPNKNISKPIVVVTSNIQNIFKDENLPRFTETLTGENQEPISLVLVTKDDQRFIRDMERAGWTLADRPDAGSILKLAKAALLNRNYPAAPMTPSFWNAKTHDFGFEKATQAQSVRERHHARFWKTNIEMPDGRRVYVGTVSLDTGIRWFVTHKIAPDIDTERELLFSDLEKAGLVGVSQKIQSVPPVLGENFTGDQFFTDGKLYIIFLK